MSIQAFYIKVEWDTEEKVWFINGTNVPGLNVEAKTREGLLSILDVIVPLLFMTDALLDGNYMFPEIEDVRLTV